MKSFKTKDISYEVKDMDMTTGQVVLYASRFNNIDSDGDIIELGAYAKTIKENGPDGKNRIKHLYQHDSWNPIGKPLDISEDSSGLLITSYISDIKNGDYRKLYEQGIITEHSVGFIPMKEEYDREANINYIKEVKLFEYSSVTWGANEDTPVVGMKGMNTIERSAFLVKRMDALSKALSSGTFTDETFVQIQTHYEQVKSDILETLKEVKPLDSTFKFDKPLDLVGMFDSEDF